MKQVVVLCGEHGLDWNAPPTSQHCLGTWGEGSPYAPYSLTYVQPVQCSPMPLQEGGCTQTSCTSEASCMNSNEILPSCISTKERAGALPYYSLWHNQTKPWCAKLVASPRCIRCRCQVMVQPTCFKVIGVLWVHVFTTTYRVVNSWCTTETQIPIVLALTNETFRAFVPALDTSCHLHYPQFVFICVGLYQN